MRNRGSNNGVIGIIIIAALVLSLVIGFNVLWYSAGSTQTCTVTEKTAVNGGKDQGTDYRLYTEECGTLQVKDALFAGKFNSADTYGQIEEGKTYEMETIGWRFGLTSTFPNVLEVTPRG